MQSRLLARLVKPESTRMGSGPSLELDEDTELEVGEEEILDELMLV
jgi:hypothetical protein